MMTHESFTEEGHCSGFQPTWKICSSQIGSFPQFSRWNRIYCWVEFPILPANWNILSIVDSKGWLQIFRWDMVVLWNTHLEVVVWSSKNYNHIYALPIQTKHLLLIVARNPNSFLTFIFQQNLQINILSVDLSRRILDSHRRYMKGTSLNTTVTTWQTSHFFSFIIPSKKKRYTPEI